MGRLGVTAAVLSAALCLAACGGPAESDRVAGPAPSSRSAPTLGDFSVADMLAEIPASVRKPGEDFTLYAGNLTQASELGGFERPTTPEAAGVWVAKLGGIGEDGPYPAFVPLTVPLAGSSPAGLVDEEFGWSVVNVDRFVSYSTLPGVTTTIAGGDFDETTLSGLHELTKDIRTAGDGADLDHDLANGTPGRPEGVSLRMAVDDGWLAASPYSPAVQEWLDGSTDSLAEDPVLAGMANLLDRGHVYSAMFTTPETLTRHDVPDVVFEKLGFTPADLPKFGSYAIGWSVSDGQPVMTVVYHVPKSVDPAAATAGIAARWHGTTFRGEDLSTLVEVGRIESTGDHVVVNVTPTGGQGADIAFVLQDLDDLMFVSR